MKINSDSELAIVLGTAFSAYANKVQNGFTGVYRPFLNGADSVVVTVKLVGLGEVIVEEGPDVDVFKAEIKTLERKVEEQAKEIKSLNILLEKQKPTPEEKFADVENYPNPILENVEEKPKRKRKKK